MHFLNQRKLEATSCILLHKQEIQHTAIHGPAHEPRQVVLILSLISPQMPVQESPSSRSWVPAPFIPGLLCAACARHRPLSAGVQTTCPTGEWWLHLPSSFPRGDLPLCFLLANESRHSSWVRQPNPSVFPLRSSVLVHLEAMFLKLQTPEFDHTHLATWTSPHS